MIGRDPNEPHRAATPARAALRPHVRRRVQPDLGAQAAHYLELGRRRDGAHRVRVRDVRDLRGRGSTTRGSRRPTTTTTSSSASRRSSRCSACSIVALGVPDAVPLDRRGRAPRQRRDGRRLRRHARRDDRALAAGRQARPRAPARPRSPTWSTSSIAQVGWVALIFVNLPLGTTLAITVVLIALRARRPATSPS